MPNGTHFLAPFYGLKSKSRIVLDTVVLNNIKKHSGTISSTQSEIVLVMMKLMNSYQNITK